MTRGIEPEELEVQIGECYRPTQSRRFKDAAVLTGALQMLGNRLRDSGSKSLDGGLFDI